MKRHLFLLFLLLSASGAKAQFFQELAIAAEGLTQDHVRYDPGYYSIDYPMGDVPADVGVCTDVVIRAYRKMNIDLQVLVHEDMKNNFTLYPSLWGLSGTDRNIDHRRVPNLMTYFKRRGASIQITNNPTDYLPGDVVSWNLGGATSHIGIVSGQKAPSGRYYIVHNIGGGQVLEDMLFAFKIIGHYRFQP